MLNPLDLFHFLFGDKTSTTGCIVLNGEVLQKPSIISPKIVYVRQYFGFYK
jgi:hypothetical protein